MAEIRDLKLIYSVKVLSDRDFVSIVRKLEVGHRLLEIDIVDNVCSFVAPVANHTLPAEFHPDHLLKMTLAVGSVFELSNLVKASRGAHELEDVVYGKHTPHLGLESRSFETWHDHEA